MSAPASGAGGRAPRRSPHPAPADGRQGPSDPTGQDRAHRQGQHLAPPDDRRVHRPAGGHRPSLILSVILQAPLLDPANLNATPNPSKAPWYFLGLQELLSYFDPQIAGVTVPTIVGLIGFMAVPYVDRNPSTKPSDRKFAVMLYTIFMAGAATLTIFGVLFRGRGFNFAYPWKDGVFFDDLKDWVYFE